ncbi:DsrE/DsrF/DrsH-like family protein [Marasmitruncus massiliensis]|uniref:DsrE/DsrF/DrsH-like family protein n=1 Tax=Marasmitruncus massiliensis TaxID=1944642 RepID=UPI00311A3A59
MRKILIVGGVAGGASAAARMRRLDEHAEIILFERGEYISFANCGLPYYIGGEITERSALTLQTPESFNARFRVDVRVQSEVLSIDRAGKTVSVRNLKTGEEYTESYDKLILSPGAAPVKPAITGVDSGRVFTLRNIPDTYRIKDFLEEKHPKTAVVVGGGYIGVEMAENLVHAGVKVTIVEFSDHLIAPLDYEMACDVHNHVREKGVKLILGDGVKAIDDTGNELLITLGCGEISADMAILSVGVRPDSLLARKAGLEVNGRGAILVNAQMRTSDSDIYAVGDAVEITDFVTGGQGYIPLAGPANKQGRIAADNIAGIASTYGGTQGTGILKVFDLTVATTGITEAKARQEGLPYEKSYTYSASHASYYPGAVNMSVKLLFEKDGGRILGAQIVGFDGVDKRIDVIATAMRAGMTVYDLTKLELAYAPPFSSAKDPVNMAGFVAENVLEGRVKLFHWNEVDTLPRDGSVTLLDVRTAPEFRNGGPAGFVNIPLDELRAHVSELDRSKPVYATCQIGLRGYVACRMLSQLGFDCYNLSGGCRLYNSVFGRQGIVREDVTMNSETMLPTSAPTVKINACGLQCPGPIMKLGEAVKKAADGEIIEIQTTDPAFSADVEAWCRRTGNTFGGVKSEKGVYTALVKKGGASVCAAAGLKGDKKNIIVFSGDLDKAIASFIIANAAVSMGRQVSMFFTFWGLNILRRPERVKTGKDFMSRMFGAMMPRGSQKLSLSKMNMGGMGAKMIRGVMKNKHIDSLEDLIKASRQNGIELVACSMSMDVMGIKKEELIDGVKLGGAAAMLANAEESDMSLFI